MADALTFVSTLESTSELTKKSFNYELIINQRGLRIVGCTVRLSHCIRVETARRPWNPRPTQPQPRIRPNPLGAVSVTPMSIAIA